MSKTELIKTLCENWIKEAYANGEIQISPRTERFRLQNNNIKFDELNFDELITAGVGLTKILLLKGRNTIVHQDHTHFWSWAAEIILEPEDCFFNEDENELRTLFEVVIRSALADSRPPTNDLGYISLLQRVKELTEFNAKQLLENCSLITAYLGFPLLEGVCKKLCSDYVDYTGKVRKEFTAPDRNGDRTYSIGKTCSNLGHLLYLLHTRVASPTLSGALTELIKHIEQLGNGESGYQIIYYWRNASLHGETSFPTIGGTLVSIAILICLHHKTDQYDAKKTRILERIKHSHFSRFSGQRPPWEFYPPY